MVKTRRSVVNAESQCVKVDQAPTKNKNAVSKKDAKAGKTLKTDKNIKERNNQFVNCVVRLKRLESSLLNNVPTEIKKLRERKVVNYEESLIDVSTKSELNVPVYKNNPPCVKKTTEDPYDFIDECPVSRKRRISDVSFKCNIQRKKIKKPIRRLNSPQKIYKDKINSCLDKIKAQMRAKHQDSPLRATNLLDKFDEYENDLSNNSSCFDTPESTETFFELDDVNHSDAKPFRVEGLTRNPHFIHLKENAMPSLNQDIIMNSTFDEYIEKVNNTIVVPPKKSPVQQKLTKYFEDKENIHENVRSYSLYDSHLLSPLKSNRNTDVSRVKRNILGTIQHTSTPTRCEKNVPEPDVSVISEGTWFDGLATPKEKRPEEMPFRVDSAIKVYRKRKSHIRTEHKTNGHTGDKTNGLIDVENEIEENEDDEERASVEIRLFDDVEEIDRNLDEDNLLPCKIKKRKRYLSTDDKPKKKRDPRTAAEIKAANEWMKQFNSMCEEVDQTVLEIESEK